MIPPCPSETELIHFLDGESTRNRSDAIGDHLLTCARCRATVDRLRQLTADLAAPLVAPPGPDEVARIMAMLDRAPPAPPRSIARRSFRVAGAGLAAAFALAVGTAILRPGSAPDETFQARGAPSTPSLARDVGVTLHASGGTLVPLAAGATITGAQPLTASYRNLLPADRPVFLLLFAVDAQGEVHWLHPAYVDPHGDPAAVLLPPATSETLLPDSVVLDHPAAGTLRVVTLLLPEPHRVSEIERLPAGSRSPEKLAATFRGAQQRELRLHIAP